MKLFYFLFISTLIHQIQIQLNSEYMYTQIQIQLNSQYMYSLDFS